MVTKELNNIGKCRLCDQHMTHYRLYGYQCHNRDHRNILQNIYTQADWDDKKIEKAIRDWRKEHGYETN